MVYSPIAVRLGIRNVPEDWEIANLQRLCNELLEPTRELLEVPIVISSGFRSRKLNNLIGGAANSFHCLGLAADWESPGVSNRLLFEKIRASDLPFDQLILEFHDEEEPQSGWIHLGYSDSPRRQTLAAFREAGKTAYRVV